MQPRTKSSPLIGPQLIKRRPSARFIFRKNQVRRAFLEHASSPRTNSVLTVMRVSAALQEFPLANQLEIVDEFIQPKLLVSGTTLLKLNERCLDDPTQIIGHFSIKVRVKNL